MRLRVAKTGPGLLGWSATFIAHESDVVAGHAFCSTRDNGRSKAVDSSVAAHGGIDI